MTLTEERRDAEFEIRGESNSPDDVTYSCPDHVGALLGSFPNGHQNRSWTVIDITLDENSGASPE